MSTVRGFLVAFGAVASVLMVLISMVLVGSTLMNEFAGGANVLRALFSSAVLSLVLSVPLAAAGYYGRSGLMIRS